MHYAVVPNFHKPAFPDPPAECQDRLDADRPGLGRLLFLLAISLANGFLKEPRNRQGLPSLQAMTHNESAARYAQTTFAQARCLSDPCIRCGLGESPLPN